MSNITNKGYKMSENAGKMQGSNKFIKGKSGNPKGKIKGTKNKTTLTAELLLEGEIGNICRRLIDEALNGNMQAIKMVLDRIMPPRKDRSIAINIPILKNSSDILQAMSFITDAVGSGNISPSEGEALSRIIDVYVKALEIHDYENRLQILENKHQ